MSTSLSPLLAPMLSSAAMRAIRDDVVCLQHILDFEAALAKAATSSGNLAIPLVKALTAAIASTDAEAVRHVHWSATAQLDVKKLADLLEPMAYQDASQALIDRLLASLDT